MLFDLAFHHWARSVLVPSNGFCVRLDVPALRYAAIAGLRNVVKNSRDKIPYGIDFAHDCFDTRTGAWLLGPIGRGLTCATFVVAALRATGIDLIKVESWPVRDDDKAWKDHVVEQLRKYGHEEQALYVSQEDLGTRIRPSEVAGSGLVGASEWPLPFARAVELAGELLGQLARG